MIEPCFEECKHCHHSDQHHGMWCRLGNCPVDGCPCQGYCTVSTIPECPGCPPYGIFDVRMKRFKANPRQFDDDGSLALPAWVPCTPEEYAKNLSEVWLGEALGLAEKQEGDPS